MVSWGLASRAGRAGLVAIRTAADCGGEGELQTAQESPDQLCLPVAQQRHACIIPVHREIRDRAHQRRHFRLSLGDTVLYLEPIGWRERLFGSSIQRWTDAIIGCGLKELQSVEVYQK